ncbi:hypothetical protein [Erythrobacter sp. EC-HK427]|uniref:hypothetical protein n=1 Tax=Erythrobacter sp. EC-HK427 TaxID=2038396 RepID=UPI001251DCC0|nr:hypothetical protein [Erythrobacter sp. EC-HK427]VVT17315.1 conserved exported hypothetical protein [Erythrobacter sp. EC-HK427]
MLRQLLTLLAVFSGFTLAAEPVQAAQGAVVSVAASAAASEQQAAGYTLGEQQLSVAETLQTQTFEAAEQRFAIPAAPSVRLQADRARE